MSYSNGLNQCKTFGDADSVQLAMAALVEQGIPFEYDPNGFSILVRPEDYEMFPASRR